MANINQLFDIPEEDIPEVQRFRKLKTPLLNYEIDFINNHTKKKYSITLKYCNDAEFFARFKVNYFNCTPVAVIKTDINFNKIKVI